MSNQNPIPVGVPGILVVGAELDLNSKPAGIPDGVYFTVGASRYYDDDEPSWEIDHTLVTDNYTVAVLWAYAYLSRSSDGEHPAVAEIIMHTEDPAEIDWDAFDDDLDVAAYVVGGDVVERDDQRYGEIAEATHMWSEIAKTMTHEDDDDGEG